jgi:spermidine synthase
MTVTRARAATLAFFTAAVTLFLQVLIHRMVSVKLLNNYAFLVISLTMLGFALSGVLLSFRLSFLLDRLPDVASICAGLCAITTLGAAVVFYGSQVSAPPLFSRPQFVAAFLRWIPFALLFTLPFALCGLILGLLLSSRDYSTRQVYFADLVGSAAGAFLVVPAIGWIGVEASTIAACAVLLAAAALLAPPRGLAGRVTAVLGAVAIVAAAAGSSRLFLLRFPAGSVQAATEDPRSGHVLEHTAWDALARIEVSRIPPPDPSRMVYPCLIGGNRDFLARFRRMLTQNNYAFTYAVDYDGKHESLRGIEETIYSAAYHATSVPAPKVAIIGVGGGFDILNALYFNASDITAVEVNAATMGILLRTYRDYFGSWTRDPRLRLVEGEGRHVLSGTPERFDVIQLSGVDSYSGTPGAAHVFSENYLYTAEAFDLYLSRLRDQGILNLMRLEFTPPREMLRALVTAVEALRRAGITKPADHVVTVTATNGYFTALLVKKTPFLPAEVARLREWAGSSPYFKISSAPPLDAPPANMYQAFLSMGSPARERAFVAAYPFDISPARDDRPFFFKYSFWWHVFPSDPKIWAEVPVMEYSLMMLATVIAVAALVCIYLPLRWLSRSGAESLPARRYALVFAGAGVGYLAIEVALLQKFGLFLGHPNYALSVVLASLLFASGLGSLFSGGIVGRLGGLRFVSYALAGVILAEHLLLMPLLPRLITTPFPVRVAITFALVLPIGVGLGTFLPTALERLKVDAPHFVPWAWGINGIFSVLAPVLAVAVSMSFGISALLLAALPVYLVVGWAFPETPAATPRS